MSKLQVGGAPLSPWSVTEGLKDLGLNHALESGQIQVAPDGAVTVYGRDAVKVHTKLRSQADVQRLLAAVGTLAGPGEAHVPTRQALDIFGTVRAVGLENRVNDRRWYGAKLTTDLRPEFTFGNRFTAPLVRIEAADAGLKRSNIPIAGLDQVEAFFSQRDGSVLLPMHPQELEHRGYPASATSLDVRCASSERSVHAQLPGMPDAILKLDLAHVLNSDCYRSLEPAHGLASVAITEFLGRWVAARGTEGDPFCFLPEPMTVADVKNGVAAVVRLTDPYPPAPNGQRTWVMPMFSLIARDPDFPDEPPMLIRLVKSRPDESVPALQYALDTVVEPLIESAMRVYLDLGASAQAHQQNTFLEIGEDGRPTGRIAHSDLESMWPHPDLAKDLGRPDFFASYGFPFTPETQEARLFFTFTAYFESQNLGPLIDCLSRELELPRSEVSQAVSERLSAAVAKREHVVRTNPVLRGFTKYLPET
ncbi:MAG: hypothetical protein IPJ65_21915 [Archangiaceae bacterium]|nr:hypothetical protein [Archangiaceae bacterium]